VIWILLRLITNLDGEVVQHVEYVPFGEVFIEERNNTWNTPYLFNAKELDEETGLYYYGARYYDSRTSIWLHVDALAEMYSGMNPYNFCSNNPINKIDPDGNWDVDVHAYKDRSKGSYAVFIVKDRKGNEVYRTVVKTIGVGGRTRNVKNSDTPQGRYKILGYRKTGEGTNYNKVSYGPNDLLALDYQGEEGGSRNGMHIHGGRQEGRYEGRVDLSSTQGCMRINDKDILELQKITNALEKNDPLDKKGVLNLTDDLQSSVQYSENRHDAGTEQFPRSSSHSQDDSQLIFPINVIPVVPVDNTRVVVPQLPPL
jgi:RHS repeat-associated protein